MLSVRWKCVKYARALFSEFAGTIRGEAMMSMARDGDRVWMQRQKKKKNSSAFHFAPAFGTWPPVVALFSYYLKFFRCRWLVIRTYNDRLNGSRLSARTFINSRAGLFYYYRNTFCKLYNASARLSI